MTEHGVTSPSTVMQTSPAAVKLVGIHRAHRDVGSRIVQPVAYLDGVLDLRPRRHPFRVLRAEARLADLGQAGPDTLFGEVPDGAFHVAARERAGERDAVDDLSGRFSARKEVLHATQDRLLLRPGLPGMKQLVDRLVQAVEMDADKTPGRNPGDPACNGGIGERDPTRPDIVDKPEIPGLPCELVPVVPAEGISPEPVDRPDSRCRYLAEDPSDRVRRDLGSRGVLCRCVTVPAPSAAGEAGLDLHRVDPVLVKIPDDPGMVRVKAPQGGDRAGIRPCGCVLRGPSFKGGVEGCT